MSVPLSSAHDVNFSNQRVREAFEAMPADIRHRLLWARSLIYDVAVSSAGLGPVVEDVKWNQPSYTTGTGRDGTPLRLGQTRDGAAAVFVHCQTSVIPDFAHVFGDRFVIEGSRAVKLPEPSDEHAPALRHLVHAALTYHRTG